MPGKAIHAIFAALTLLLAGCSTDGLTPTAEIPGAQQTADATPGDQQPQQQIDEIPAQRTTREKMPPIDSEDNETATSDDRAPQNTLEAQAQAIDQGQDNPSLTKAKDPGNLGANLYKSDSKTQVTSLYTATATKGTIRFLPIIGAPVQAVTPLSKELGASARGNGLTIKASGDQTAEHVLKGYLSAFADGGNVTVVYVWDVLDNAGARLHRIQGQQSVKATGGDTWSSVPPETMQEIGVETIAEYMKWRQSQG